MKKIVKRILIGVSIVIAVVVLLFVGLFLKMKSETKVMTPLKTGWVVDQIFALNESFVNTYLIKDSDSYIVVDAGNNIDNVATELKKLAIKPDKVSAVLLTHTDADHVAALSLFKNAKVYLSIQEEKMIDGSKNKVFLIKNKISTNEYILLEDQQVITIGNTKIQGILTQGHTFGSMCYLMNDKYLFIGDVLSLKAGKIGKFNEFFNMDTETAINSIEKITKLPIAEYIFTAHYGYTSDYKYAVADWGQ